MHALLSHLLLRVEREKKKEQIKKKVYMYVYFFLLFLTRLSKGGATKGHACIRTDRQSKEGSINQHCGSYGLSPKDGADWGQESTP